MDLKRRRTRRFNLGFRREALQIAQASVDGERYAAATPRERALLV
jgi:hypothetical protein